MERLEELRQRMRELCEWRRLTIGNAEREIHAAEKRILEVNRRFDAEALALGKEIQQLEPPPPPAPVNTPKPRKQSQQQVNVEALIAQHFESLSPEERNRYANQDDNS